MMFVLAFFLCTASGQCDSFAQKVDHCAEPAQLMFQIQALLAQTDRYHGEKITGIHCVAEPKE